MIQATRWTALVLCTLVFACKGPPTWHDEVQPIISAHCSGCHSDLIPNPTTFALDTYAQAAPWSQVIANATANLSMPPWPARPTSFCAAPPPWQHDIRLNPQQIATLAAWAEGGAPEGERQSETQPAPFIGSPSLDDYDANIVLDEYTTDATEDSYMCFPIRLDPAQIGASKWITDTEVVPGVAAIHHTILYQVSTELLDYYEEAIDTPYWPCFGGFRCAGADCPAVPSDVNQQFSLAGGWVPGSGPVSMPDGSGLEVTDAHAFVLQVHYHPLGEAETDGTTSVRFKFHDADTNPAWTAGLRHYGIYDAASPQAFTIEAGDNETTVHYQLTLHRDIRLWAIVPHMHWVGTQIQVVVYRAATAATECLAHVPEWDYEWQRVYSYAGLIDELPQISAGDSIVVKCVYNNSPTNPNLAGLNPPYDFTQDVGVGELSTDEMCVVVLGVLHEPGPWLSESGE